MNNSVIITQDINITDVTTKNDGERKYLEVKKAILDFADENGWDVSFECNAIDYDMDSALFSANTEVTFSDIDDDVDVLQELVMLEKKIREDESVVVNTTDFATEDGDDDESVSE